MVILNIQDNNDNNNNMSVIKNAKQTNEMKDINHTKETKLKKYIPKALREQVWLINFGKKYQHKCYSKWCNNIIDVFNYEVGHNIPESKGGETKIDNLKPICSRCNKSMNNKYTIEQWNKLVKPKKKSWFCGLF